MNSKTTRYRYSPLVSFYKTMYMNEYELEGNSGNCSLLHIV